METLSMPFRRAISLVFGVGVALLCAGCASTKIDWDSRLGVYTYDQAVLELGPPDKSATLSDGVIVAEWLTQRGSPGGYAGAYYGPPRPYPYWRGYVAPAYYYDPPTPSYFLRLTFDAEGRLSAWQRVVR